MEEKEEEEEEEEKWRKASVEFERKIDRRKRSEKTDNERRRNPLTMLEES